MQVRASTSDHGYVPLSTLTSTNNCKLWAKCKIQPQWKVLGSNQRQADTGGESAFRKKRIVLGEFYFLWLLAWEQVQVCAIQGQRVRMRWLKWREKNPIVLLAWSTRRQSLGASIGSQKWERYPQELKGSDNWKWVGRPSTLFVVLFCIICIYFCLNAITCNKKFNKLLNSSSTSFLSMLSDFFLRHLIRRGTSPLSLG